MTLARAGVRVTLLEQARVLGGRARRVVQDGIALDNGQHLLVGANRQSLDLIAEAHGTRQVASLFKRLPLTLRPFGDAPPAAVSLAAWPLPAPLNLAGAILSARGLGWRERIALLTGFRRLARANFRVPKGQTVSQCFAGTPLHAVESVWEPLCIAALNTPPEAASAQHFANVLRETFAGDARASDMLVPTSGSQRIVSRGRRALRQRARGQRADGRHRAVDRARRKTHRCRRPASGSESCDAVIVAVGPHQLAATLGAASAEPAWRDAAAAVAAFDYESITTVYLGHARPLRLPLPLMRLDDAPGQWIFDRNAMPRDALPGGARGLVAVVISTGRPAQCTRSRRRLRAKSTRSCSGATARWRRSRGRASSPSGARPMPARPPSPGRRPAASTTASTSPAITPIPIFRRRSRRRPAAAFAPPARCCTICASFPGQGRPR